jgi:hypothetical protein
VSTNPAAPAAVVAIAPELAAYKIPYCVSGVVEPVPPFTTGSGAVFKLNAIVPLVVIGEPVTVKKVGAVIATDVTVPEPPVPGGVAHVPSARKNVVVPPPDAGVKPCKLELNKLSIAVTCVAVSAVGVADPAVLLPRIVSAAIVGNCANVT